MWLLISIVSPFFRAGERTRHIQRVTQLGHAERTFLERKGIELTTADLHVIDRKIKHVFRDTKPDYLKPANAAMRNMPATIRNAKAVLWDKKVKNLLYVYDDPSGKLGKIAVRVGFRHSQGKVIKAPLHAQVGDPFELSHNLRDANKYEIIKGKID